MWFLYKILFILNVDIDNNVLDQIEKFAEKKGRILSPSSESIRILSLFGPGLGTAIETIDFCRIVHLCRMLNMLSKLYLNNMKIDHLTDSDDKLILVTTIGLSSMDMRED